jgi:FKBP-type peptidyl-prolyl cis-trans isomerase
MKRQLRLGGVLALALYAACAPKQASTSASTTPAIVPPSMQTTASGLSYEDTNPGSGEAANKGQTCLVHYTGWLWENGKKGAKFDSSLDHGEPFSFRLGAGEVISGWDEGVQGMKPGGARTLLVPPDLGYGAQGAGRTIPRNATLLFEVQLIELH